jgi:hypothetical protein
VKASCPAMRTTVVSNAPEGILRVVMHVVTLKPRREGDR